MKYFRRSRYNLLTSEKSWRPKKRRWCCFRIQWFAVHPSIRQSLAEIVQTSSCFEKLCTISCCKTLLNQLSQKTTLRITKTTLFALERMRICSTERAPFSKSSLVFSGEFTRSASLVDTSSQSTWLCRVTTQPHKPGMQRHCYFFAYFKCLNKCCQWVAGGGWHCWCVWVAHVGWGVGG